MNPETREPGPLSEPGFRPDTINACALPSRTVTAESTNGTGKIGSAGEQLALPDPRDPLTVESRPAGPRPGLDLAEEHTGPDWRDVARAELEQLAVSGEEFDAYDLTSAGVPDPPNSAQWGALFRAAYRDGVIEPVAARMSTRPTRAGSLVRTWRGRREVVA